MVVQEQINEMLTKKMNRRQFLQFIALSLVAVSSFNSILRILQKNSSKVSATGEAGSLVMMPMAGLTTRRNPREYLSRLSQRARSYVSWSKLQGKLNGTSSAARF